MSSAAGTAASPAASAAILPSKDMLDAVAKMMAAAMGFVSQDRCEALFRRWLAQRDMERKQGDKQLAMAADALLLSAALVVSQPSLSGSTAFDRLARAAAGAPAVETAAIAALRAARFRLLRVDGDATKPEFRVVDAVLNAPLRIVAIAEMPKLEIGLHVFARVAELEDGVFCLPGSITPLDPAALKAAREHPAAGAASGSAGAKWAEAVYCHVVRNGTLDIPGLNRPRDGILDDDDDDEAAEDGGLLFQTAMEWMALGEDAPGADLLQRTRQLAGLHTILDALTSMQLSSSTGPAAMATAFERVIMLMLETVSRRERLGSGGLTLGAIDAAITSHKLGAKTRDLFATLRRKVVGGTGAPKAADPELERLIQRIQGLRAKTVERGCTEQEALSAAEKVAELLDRYGLSLGELDFRAQPCEGIGIQTNRRRMAPIDSCVTVIAAFFDCRAWQEKGRDTTLRYVFFGMRGDVAAAQYLYEMVERAFETETNAFRASDLYQAMRGDRRTATNSFQVGLARGIADKLRTMRAARDATLRSSSGRDLVPMKAAVVDDEFAKLGMDFHSRTVRRGRRVLSDAFDAGREAGENFEFASGITHAA